MKLLFVPGGLQEGDIFPVPTADAKHLVKVLRLDCGDEVAASDGARRIRCTVARVRPRCELRVESAEPLVDTRRLRLAIAAIEVPRLSVVASAAAQMAVREVCILRAERSDPVRVSMDRLGRVASEAAKQVGCPFLPSFIDAGTVAEMVTRWKDGSAFLLDPEARGNLVDHMRRVSVSGIRTLLIGPAGDFTEREKTIMKDAGATPARLGSEVLRTETAAIVALGIASVCLPESTGDSI